MNATTSCGWFGPPGAECYGTLHLPPVEHRTDLALLIVGPTWHEDQSAYRTLRQLALAAAARGIATLRFDTLGAGDSNGTDDDQHPSGWRESVDAALALLRAQAGVTRLCVVGTRAGALPAVLAASERDDVVAFVGIAPVVRGSSYLREARLRTATPPVDAKAGFEHGGHRISARARAELSAIDLGKLARPPALRVMLVDAGQRPEHASWRAHLERQGARLHSIAAPGLTRIFDGEYTVSPELVERIAGWIAAQVGDPGAVTTPAAPAAALRSTLELAGARETPWSAQVAGTSLFGMLATPAHGEVRRAIVILNTGSGRRIGPSRMYVDWGRRWARDGVAVLRLDLPGLGDSGVQPGEVEGEAYLTETAPAIAVALADLRARHGAIDCTLLGICSGAYHAWRAALDGAAIDALVLINQTAYRWGPGMRVDAPSALLRLSAHLDLQRADTPIDRSPLGRLRALRWRAVKCAYDAIGALRDTARQLGRPLDGDVGAALEALARRGVAVHTLVAEHDRAAPLLRLEAARSIDALQRAGRLRVETIAAADHLFTVAATRERLQVALDRALAERWNQLPGLRASANAATATVPIAASASSIWR